MLGHTRSRMPAHINQGLQHRCDHLHLSRSGLLLIVGCCVGQQVDLISGTVDPPLAFRIECLLYAFDKEGLRINPAT
eukprot:SAG11_NODE_326_length_10708_cov_6.937035_9_plen_77_part_00